MEFQFYMQPILYKMSYVHLLKYAEPKWRNFFQHCSRDKEEKNHSLDLSNSVASFTEPDNIRSKIILVEVKCLQGSKGRFLALLKYALLSFSFFLKLLLHALKFLMEDELLQPDSLVEELGKSQAEADDLSIELSFLMAFVIG